MNRFQSEIRQNRPTVQRDCQYLEVSDNNTTAENQHKVCVRPHDFDFRSPLRIIFAARY
jgi:hypothetical protein